MSKKKHPWHPADILCALSKIDLNYAEVARRHELNPSTVANAAHRPQYAGEQAISKELGVPAHQIWPDRYDAEGLPLHKKVRRVINADIAARKRQILEGERA